MSEEKVGSKSTSEYIKCPACGEVVKAKGKYAHFSQNHPDLDYNEYKDKFVAAPPPEGAKREGVWKEGADANRILEQVLESNPDVPSKQVKELMSWAELRGQLHPMEVAHLLNNMKGISSQTANIVSQKYAFALQKAATEGKAQISIGLLQSPLVQQLQGQYPMAGAWPTQPGMGPQQPEQTPFMTREEYDKRERERRAETEMSNIRSRVDKLDKDFANALSGLEERISEKIEAGKEPSTQYETIIEYFDAEGNLCSEEKAVSERVRKVPIATRGSTEVSQLREEIRGLHKTIQDKEVASLKDDIKELKGMIGKKPEKPEEIPELRDLKTRLDQSENRYNELKDKIESEDRERLQSELKELRTQLGSLRLTSGEYKTDEGKNIGIALDKIGTALDKFAEKDRLGTAKEILAPAGVTSTMPPAQRAGEAERGGVLGELRTKGLVRTILERKG